MFVITYWTGKTEMIDLSASDVVEAYATIYSEADGSHLWITGDVTGEVTNEYGDLCATISLGCVRPTDTRRESELPDGTMPMCLAPASYYLPAIGLNLPVRSSTTWCETCVTNDRPGGGWVPIPAPILSV